MPRSDNRGYVLKEAEGNSYRWSPFGYLFTIKARLNGNKDSIAFIEFVTEKGKEPGSHVHKAEDEIFYVLSGELTVTCGEDSLNAGPRDFVFLPSDVPHSYKITSDGPVHLLVVTITYEADGRHFARDIEQNGEPVNRDTVLRYREDVRTR
jgi:quercetin dioxygenase-like cupin family protein